MFEEIILAADFLTDIASIAGSNTLFKVLKSPECFETHGNNSETDKHTGSKKFTGRQFLGHGLHPLRHAVMAAIEMAAARDRRLFPTDRISKCRPDETEFEDIPVSSKKHRSVEVNDEFVVFPAYSECSVFLISPS